MPLCTRHKHMYGHGYKEHRDAIREAQGIPPIVALANDGTDIQKVHAETALGNLADGPFLA